MPTSAAAMAIAAVPQKRRRLRLITPDISVVLIFASPFFVKLYT
jgi:hypothetical protein